MEGDRSEVTLGVAIPKVDKCKYLGSIIKKRGDIEDDINHRIRVAWKKWRNVSGVLCDVKVHVSLKWRVYRMVVQPALIYGVECWPVKRTQVQRLMVAEMRMIRWMCGFFRLDRIRNEVIRQKVRVVPIEE